MGTSATSGSVKRACFSGTAHPSSCSGVHHSSIHCSGVPRSSPTGRSSDKLKLLTWNSFRLSSTLQLELQYLLDTYIPHVAVVTETDLNEEDLDALNVPGYKVVPSCKTNGVTRVVMCVKDNVRFTLQEMCKTAPVVNIYLNDFQLAVVGVYRQHLGQDQTLQRAEVAEIADIIQLSAERFPVCLLGDINLNMNRLNDASYSNRILLQKWLEVMSASNLHWLHTGPTWQSFGNFQGINRTSVLDHVYVDSQFLPRASVEVLGDAFTDHFPVLATISTKFRLSERQSLQKVRQRVFKSIEFDPVNSDINSLGLSQLPPPVGLSVEAYLTDFYTIINSLLDKHAPYKTFKVRRNTTPLSLQSDTLTCMKQRDRARAKKWDNEYRILRNKCVRLIKRDRILTSKRKIEEANCSQEAAWSLTKSLMKSGDSSLSNLSGCNSDKESANKANNYFINKVSELRKKLSMTAGSTDSGPASTLSERSFSLHCVGKNTVLNVIKKLNNSKAIGADGIPITFWKQFVEPLAIPIMHLVNLSIRLRRYMYRLF